MSIGIRVAKIRLLDTRQSFRLGAEHRLEPDEWPELATHRFCLPQTEPVDHLIASAPYVRNPRIDAPREKCLRTSTARGNLRLPHNSIRSPSSATSTPLNARGALRDPIRQVREHYPASAPAWPRASDVFHAPISCTTSSRVRASARMS